MIRKLSDLPDTPERSRPLRRLAAVFTWEIPASLCECVLLLGMQVGLVEEFNIWETSHLRVCPILGMGDDGTWSIKLLHLSINLEPRGHSNARFNYWATRQDVDVLGRKEQ